MQDGTTGRRLGLVRPVVASIGGILVIAGFSVRWLRSGNGSQLTGFAMLGTARDGDISGARWVWIIIALALLGAAASLWGTLSAGATARTVSAAGALAVLATPVLGIVVGVLPLERWAVGLWLIAVGGVLLLAASVLPGAPAFSGRDADSVRHPLGRSS